MRTEHLILRKAAASDLDAIWHNIWEDDAIAQWMYWQPTKTYEDAVDRLKRTMAYQKENLAYFVCRKETNEAIGFAGVKEVAPGIYEESGICVASRYQGRGYGKEILKALLELAFVELGAERFLYACMRENEKSQKVCARFGFHYLESREETRAWDSKQFVNDFYYLDREEYFMWHPQSVISPEKRILEYIRETYHPLAIIVYGSYSNQTNNRNSDFDAMVICEKGENSHDTNIVNGIPLDVFVYSREYLEHLEDLSEIIQIWDGTVVQDMDHFAEKLKERVCRYMDAQPAMTPAEKEDLKSWCYKMLARTERQDAEGMYRWHWLLVDSLEIYCNMRDLYYLGPKKSILRLEKEDMRGYRLYSQALKDYGALNAWIDHVFCVE